ncbi:MAG: MFS transporter [Dehalococcoidia bacterium]|nr:MFS transporter [Dehalococcoidia bacterium]
MALLLPEPRLTRPALAVLCLATFVAVVHSAMSSIVLPDVKDDFGVPDDQLTWFVTAFILTFATGTLVYGRIADMVGTRWPLIVGVGIFAAGAFATAAAPDFWLAVAGRAAMGAGATAIPALSTATIARTTSAGQRGRALGWIVASVGLGFAAGPLLGAVITEEFGWQGPLVATGGAALVVMLATALFVSDAPGTDQRGFDAIGAVLFAVAVSASLIALNRLPANPGSTPGLVALAVAPIAVIAFAIWIAKRRRPFLEPGLLKRGRFMAFSLIGLLVQGMHFGVVVLLPLFWTRYHGLSFIEVGLHFLPGALALAFFGTTGGFIIERFGSRVPIIIGSWIAANGAFALFLAGANWSDWQVAGLYGVVAAGYGLTNAALMHGATSALDESETGVGVGVYTLSFFLGGAISSALAGAILRAREGTLQAWLPFYKGTAPEFSDAFAVVAAMAALAFVVALVMPVERRETPVSAGFPLAEAAGDRWLFDRQKPIRNR